MEVCLRVLVTGICTLVELHWRRTFEQLCCYLAFTEAELKPWNDECHLVKDFNCPVLWVGINIDYWFIGFSQIIFG